jgi:hypothetical protein
MTISSWVYHSNFFYECLFDVHLDKLLDSIIKACDLRDILFIDRFYLFFFKKKQSCNGLGMLTEILLVPKNCKISDMNLALFQYQKKAYLID